MYISPSVRSYIFVCVYREQDGQASGGSGFGSDDWIFTIREKDPSKLPNGASQAGAPEEEVREGERELIDRSYCLTYWRRNVEVEIYMTI